jgi:type IV pilus assembly protein PilW
MVSLVIGLVVVGAVLVSYLASGKTTRQQAAYAEMHENAQMALTILSRELLLAGYAQATRIPVVAPPAVPVFSRTPVGRAVFGCDGDFDSTPPKTGPSTKASLGNVVCANPATGKPSIEVSYEADLKNTVPAVDAGTNVPSDCKGSQIRPASGQVCSDGSIVINDNCTPPLTGVDFFITHNRFFIKLKDTNNPNMGSELYCASSTQGSDGQPVSAEPLVDNVDDIKIWYGQVDPANPRQVVRYVNAGNVDSGGHDWTQIVSVRTCLLMRSSEPVLDAELTGTPKYLDCDLTEQNLPDRYLRRAYFSTTTLRNKMAF